MFVGPRFEPDDDAALSGNGVVADGRLLKYFGSLKGCPLRAEPTGVPSFRMRLPLACQGRRSQAIPVTSSRYTRPVTTVRSASETIAGLSRPLMSVLPSGR
jgi:hypothetical protein